MGGIVMRQNEQLESVLNPHRGEELAAANQQVAARLHRRGIEVSAQEKSEDLADLLSAVERFEAIVEARGGDLMVDDLVSSEPDDPEFVLPMRDAGEPMREYIRRIEAASARLDVYPRDPPGSLAPDP
jgi:hypothetical protein